MDPKPEIEITSCWSNLLCDRSAHSNATTCEYLGNKDDILLVHNIFSREECCTLIAESEKHGYGKTNYPKRYRGNLRLMTNDTSLADALWNRMKPYFPEELTEEGHRYKVLGLNTKWRLAKYFPGDRFGGHIDAFYEDTSKGVKTMFTVNIYMNEEFRGGETSFMLYPEGLGRRGTPVSTVDVQPRTGTALCFRQPPARRYMHEGKEVTTGYKYLFRSDVMYARV